MVKKIWSICPNCGREIGEEPDRFAGYACLCDEEREKLQEARYILLACQEIARGRLEIER